MTPADAPEVVLARLDERSAHIVKELENLGIGQRATWSELNELKGETFKTRGEVAEVKGSIIQLEERERERNGQIKDLTTQGQKHDVDIASLNSRVLDIEGDIESRLKDAETNIGVLLGARHDEQLKVETVEDTKHRLQRERAEFREHWRFGFEVIGVLAVILAAGYGAFTLAHTLGAFGG